MTRKERKEQLRAAAVTIIGASRFYGEAYHLRLRLIHDHGILLSPSLLRTWMQELADEGHFIRSKYSHGGQGYTWSLPEAV